MGPGGTQAAETAPATSFPVRGKSGAFFGLLANLLRRQGKQNSAARGQSCGPEPEREAQTQAEAQTQTLTSPISVGAASAPKTPPVSTRPVATGESSPSRPTALLQREPARGVANETASTCDKGIDDSARLDRAAKLADDLSVLVPPSGSALMGAATAGAPRTEPDSSVEGIGEGILRDHGVRPQAGLATDNVVLNAPVAPAPEPPSVVPASATPGLRAVRPAFAEVSATSATDTSGLGLELALRPALAAATATGTTEAPGIRLDLGVQPPIAIMTPRVDPERGGTPHGRAAPVRGRESVADSVRAAISASVPRAGSSAAANSTLIKDVTVNSPMPPAGVSALAFAELERAMPYPAALEEAARRPVLEGVAPRAGDVSSSEPEPERPPDLLDLIFPGPSELGHSGEAPEGQSTGPGSPPFNLGEPVGSDAQELRPDAQPPIVGGSGQASGREAPKDASRPEAGTGPAYQQESRWRPELFADLRAAASADGRRMRLDLDSEDLGQLSVRLEMVGDRVRASLIADREATVSLLDGERGLLERLLGNAEISFELEQQPGRNDASRQEHAPREERATPEWASPSPPQSDPDREQGAENIEEIDAELLWRTLSRISVRA